MKTTPALAWLRTSWPKTLCAAALALLARPGAAQDPAQPVIDALTSATVYIENQLVLSASDWNALPPEIKAKLDRRPQGVAAGSGFLVSPEGYVVTNAHVVNGAVQTLPVGKPEEKKTMTLHFVSTGLKLVLHSGEPGEKSFSPRTIRVDKSADLAVLKIDSETTLPALRLNAQRHVAGEAILLAGFPGGKLPDQAPFVSSARELQTDKNPRVSVNNGSITAVREWEHDFRYQLDARANHGNSGGPVVNAAGEVIGVLYAGIDQMQSINYAIPVQYVAGELPAEVRRGLEISAPSASTEDPANPSTSTSAGSTSTTPSDGQTYDAFKQSGTFKLK